MQAEVIAVGSELLSFARSETNSLYLARQLASLGIRLNRKVVVGDDPESIREAVSRAIQKVEIILLTGGLGPTRDDLTRETVAELLERPLIENRELLETLESRYRRFGLKITENNRRQAMVPKGAAILQNPHGTAPGLLLEEAAGSVLVFLLPGPPRELYPMVENFVLPEIRRLKKVSLTQLRQLKIGSEAESRVDNRIAPIYSRYPEIETTILSSPGVISLYFLWAGDPEAPGANSALDRLLSEIKEAMGASVFSEREETIASVLGGLLQERNLLLATAESCTGGWIGKLLTDTPGSSGYYAGGVISYSDDAKIKLLGVDPGTLEMHGAVSAQVASEMAAGVCRHLSADVGLSVTGIAGPGGGSAEKPVGTIFLGFSRKGQQETRKLQLPGDREAVRLRTSHMALDWVRRQIS